MTPWHAYLNSLVDEVVADIPEQKRREIKELGNRTTSRAASGKKEGHYLPARITIPGRAEHKSCKLDYQTGEINCSNHPFHGKPPPRDQLGVKDCRQRWCPWFELMHANLIARLKHCAKREGREGVISLYNQATAE